MDTLQFLIIIAVAIALLYYIRMHYTQKEKLDETDYSTKSKPFDSNPGQYYAQKYQAKSLYNPLSQDAKGYYNTVRAIQNETYQDPTMIRTIQNEGYQDPTVIRSIQNEAMVDQSGSAHSRATNALNVNKPYVYNKADLSNTHPQMLTDAKQQPLKASDLLPNPCPNGSKDWTSVYAGCENLVGGQNFVHIEDEHFANEVLDTRCTKYQSQDLRKTPAIQYENVSIWNKPSVCKNPFELTRPGLDD